jgi:nucleotide-binding universal stress UspA family protein
MPGTMTTSTTSSSFAGPETRSAFSEFASKHGTVPVVRRGPVLLATEGFGASQSPALFARALAERLQCALRVVSVIEPVTVYAGTTGFAPMPVLIDESYASTREESVRNAVDSTWPEGTKYELDTRFGAVSREIAAHARELDASIVVLGAAPRRRRNHVLSGVLAAQVLRNVRCPVLSVVPGLDHLPRQVVAAVDFSDASLRAAREALRLLDDSGTLTLAYAIPMINAQRLAGSLADVMDSDQSMRLLERLREHLQRWAPPGRTIQVRVLDGIADDSIIQLARILEADLVAVGTHGPGVLERMFIGSTAANILHLAPCSVLAVQPPNALERAELDLEAWGSAETYDESLWGKLLDEFTKRNAGRRVRIQVDDLAFGAQLQAVGYTLRGATFDTGDRRVDLMLGAPAGSDAHLTRIISRVLSIALSRDSSGRDIALQVRTDTSETLVIFD